MIGVIKTGGKQYVVREGDTLSIEKLQADPGQTVSLELLLVADEEGKNVELGTPALTTNVTAEVLEQGRGKKVSVVHYKAKSRYKKRVGHRQPFTKVKISKIG